MAKVVREVHEENINSYQGGGTPVVIDEVISIEDAVAELQDPSAVDAGQKVAEAHITSTNGNEVVIVANSIIPASGNVWSEISSGADIGPVKVTVKGNK